MNDSVDNLFREKLFDNVQPPPATAWGRIEASFTKKNSSLKIYRAAAVLLLGLLTATIAWMNLAQNENTPSQQTYRNPAPVTATPTFREPKKKLLVAAASPGAAKRIAPQKRSTATPPRQVAPERELSSPAIVPVEENPVAVAPTQKAEARIVLVYTLEPVEDTRPAAETDAPVAKPKKKKRLHNVLNFARDAKNSEGAVSELRQAKDEFFAFNFIKDKFRNSK